MKQQYAFNPRRFHFADLPDPRPDLRGGILCVDDSSVVEWGEKVSGGGTATVLAHCNGVEWRVIGR